MTNIRFMSKNVYIQSKRDHIVSLSAATPIAALQELIWAGQAFMKSAGIIWPLFYTGIFYLLFSGLLTLLFGLIEKKLNYFR